MFLRIFHENLSAEGEVFCAGWHWIAVSNPKHVLDVHCAWTKLQRQERLADSRFLIYVHLCTHYICTSLLSLGAAIRTWICTVHTKLGLFVYLLIAGNLPKIQSWLPVLTFNRDEGCLHDGVCSGELPIFDERPVYNSVTATASLLLFSTA